MACSTENDDDDPEYEDDDTVGESKGSNKDVWTEDVCLDGKIDVIVDSEYVWSEDVCLGGKSDVIP